MISYRLLTTTSLAALAFAGASARAQDSAAQDQPPEATLPQTIPGLENFSLPPSNDRLRLPQSAPTPVPTPRASPIPTPTPPPASRATPAQRPATPPPLMIQPLPTPTPGAARPANREPPPRATATPASTPTPAAAPTTEPQAEATPSAAPAIAPSPTSIPAPASAPAAPQPTAGAADDANGRSRLLLVLALLAIAATAGLVWLWLARRGGEADADEAAIEPVPVAPPRPSPPTEPGARPRLDLAFTPRRAGMNVLSAAVDYELVVRNRGAAEAQGVRIALQLFTAGEHHDTELRDYLDAPVDAPIVTAFDLAPGEAKTMRAIALLPKEAVNVVTVQGRPMFVPLVAINAVYHWDGGDGQTATSHVVGIAQPGAAKMQPFWLDAPPRMYDGVGEHAHAIAVTR